MRRISMPLSDNQQAYLTFASMLFIAAGAVTVPSGHPYLVLVLELVGVIGMTLKEFLGAEVSPSSAPVVTPPPPPAPTPTPVVSPPATLPPLPQGFSLAAAKAAGDKVYENAQGNIILISQDVNAAGQPQTDYTDLYGNVLSNHDLTGYTQL